MANRWSRSPPFWLRKRRMLTVLLYVIAALSLVWLLVSTAWMRRTASPSTGAGPPPHESCAKPAMRLGGQADRRWLDLHEIYAGQAREMTGRALLFLGDSLTLVRTICHALLAGALLVLTRDRAAALAGIAGVGKDNKAVWAKCSQFWNWRGSHAARFMAHRQWGARFCKRSLGRRASNWNE